MIDNSDDKPQQYGHLIIIVGLPGSGKSTYMELLRTDNPDFSFFDDYQGSAYGEDSDPRLSKHFGSLASDLKRGKTAVVSDIRYCEPGELNLFLSVVLNAAPNVTLAFRYFENAPEVCRENVTKRDREVRVEKELELIDRLSKSYAIPTVEILSVHNPNNS